MENENKHIEDYIKNYVSLNEEPGYAILLKGKWGTGKTWFINKLLSDLPDIKDPETGKNKYLYVSLYGITSFDQIDNEFFKQLHPILSSKTMDVVGKVARGLLKASVKIDLDTHHSVSASPQLPNLELPDFLKNTSDFLIVFDDLERASIPLDSLMGYINHFVEQQGRKVIILANEEEINSQSSKDVSKQNRKNQETTPLDENNKNDIYFRIKEKLIGKTFEVKPYVEDAIKSFLQHARGKLSQNYYSANIEIILEIYNESTYKNLRHLKQALWDFEFLLIHIKKVHHQNIDLLNHLLKIYLALSFEIKSGNFQAQNIPRFADSTILMYKELSDNETSENEILKIPRQYPSVTWSDFIFDYPTWVEILDGSIFNKEAMEKAICESSYVKKENPPSWKIAYFARNTSQKVLDDALNDIDSNLKHHKIKQVGVLLHIVGVYLWLQDEGIISTQKNEIVREACDYINNMEDGDLIAWKKTERNDVWDNCGYMERDTNEFKETIKHLEIKVSEALERTYPEHAKNLLVLMKTDGQKFFMSMVLTNSSCGEYYNIPILAHISAQDFVKSLMETPEHMWKYIAWTFSSRYENPSLILLHDEETFVKEISEILNIILKFEMKKLLGLQIRDLLKQGIDCALEYLAHSNTK
ncbi:P-loop NTPase fold protein [Rouxiella badensis]|uniref:P-loop NTPase fold protein n=1 Tax=Rouxiella badensis TaxID=1646377 RepID=UPI0022AAC7E8|nr:P-loop NTPase fold protein [Rouxiella badensis]WAT10169.1 P-loop NTPase fold protein [Rouxiella badensis]